MPAEPAVRLTGRSSSHFTRVARIVAHELGVPVALDVVHDLASLDPARYGGHPGLKIPTLHVGGTPLFGTDNICRRLAELAGRADDPRIVLSHHVTADLARSAQELVWHAMAAQVQLVVGRMLGAPAEESLLLAKASAGLDGTLAWLDAHLAAVLAALPAPRELSVLEVTLFCLVDHLGFRATVPVDGHAQLRRFADAFGARTSARQTRYRFDPAPAPAPDPDPEDRP